MGVIARGESGDYMLGQSCIDRSSDSVCFILLILVLLTHCFV
jgi:hypothetical protein